MFDQCKCNRVTSSASTKTKFWNSGYQIKLLTGIFPASVCVKTTNTILYWTCFFLRDEQMKLNDVKYKCAKNVMSIGDRIGFFSCKRNSTKSHFWINSNVNGIFKSVYSAVSQHFPPHIWVKCLEIYLFNYTGSIAASVYCHLIFFVGFEMRNVIPISKLKTKQQKTGKKLCAATGIGFTVIAIWKCFQEV